MQRNEETLRNRKAKLLKTYKKYTTQAVKFNSVRNKQRGETLQKKIKIN